METQTKHKHNNRNTCNKQHFKKKCKKKKKKKKKKLYTWDSEDSRLDVFNLFPEYIILMEISN